MFNNKKVFIVVALLGVLIPIVILFNRNKNEEIVDTITYDIVFDSNGGSLINNQKVVEGHKLKKPSDPVKEGYIFECWLYNEEMYDFTTNVYRNLNLKAKWYLKETDEDVFKVEFDTDGGSVIKNSVVKSGDTVTKPSNPSKDGYEFISWTLNGEEYDFKTEVKDNLKLTAKWEKLDCNVVSFDSFGGSKVTSQNVEEGKKAVEPNKPTREGYNFICWYYCTQKFNFNNVITKSMTLRAKWEQVGEVFTISFNANGGSSVKSQSVVEGNVVSKPVNPSKDGYIFVGWKLGNVLYDFKTKINSDIILIATWEKENIVLHTVSFDSNEGSFVDNQIIKDGGVVSKPSNPTKTGYTFIGWNNGSAEYNFNLKVNNDIHLTAVWEKVINYYTVSFDSNGGSNVNSQSIKEGDSAVKPSNPTRDGYIFIDWNNGNSTYDFNSKVNSNIVLSATWEKIKTYTVKITVIDGESNINRRMVVYSDGVETSDVKAVYTTDGLLLDNSAPFNINVNSISKLNGKVKLVLTNNKEVIASIG